tara:strand:- start:222 stop:395 length:174 start_codon:yes stop_codon:yes gene_type:complete
MDEIEFITEKDVKKTIENFSIEELKEYKSKLLGYIDLVEGMIKKKILTKNQANKLFK